MCRKNRKSSHPTHIRVFAKDVTNKNEIANEFNNYFTSIGPEMSNIIPQVNRSYRSYLDKVINSKFNCSHTNNEEIQKNY